MDNFKSYLLKVWLLKARGFTLIEALVAISILLLGVLGPLSAATRGITDGLIAKSQLVALGLAQEGIELVRAKVDNLSGQWLGGGEADPSVCLSPTTCLVEVRNNIYEICTGTGCNLLSNVDGIYVPATTPDASGQLFRREIKIEKSSPVAGLVDNNTEAKVTITVGWWDKGTYRSLFLTTYIYNINNPNTAL
ncbi:MAG: prepilin-type N-terminal cleavage/methylation domain-containing protein [Patescibacteria group bacterium]